MTPIPPTVPTAVVSRTQPTRDRLRSALRKPRFGRRHEGWQGPSGLSFDPRWRQRRLRQLFMLCSLPDLHAEAAARAALNLATAKEGFLVLIIRGDVQPKPVIAAKNEFTTATKPHCDAEPPMQNPPPIPPQSVPRTWRRTRRQAHRLRRLET